MPWYIIKSNKCPAGKPYAVISEGSGKVVGCHETKAKAREQQKALYAAQQRGEID